MTKIGRAGALAQRRGHARRGEHRAAAAERRDDDVAPAPAPHRAPRAARWLAARRCAAGARALRRPADDEARAGRARRNCSAISSPISAGPISSAAQRVEIAMDVAREIERRGGERQRPLGDARLAPHPARAGEGARRSAPSSAGADQARAPPPTRCAALHLAQHMRLADDEAVERARHGEEMAQRRRALVAIERRASTLLGRAAQCGSATSAHESADAARALVAHAARSGRRSRSAPPRRAAAPRSALERAVEIVFDQRKAIAQLARGLVR